MGQQLKTGTDRKTGQQLSNHAAQTTYVAYALQIGELPTKTGSGVMPAYDGHVKHVLASRNVSFV